ncbi:hypothetical protein HU200_016988 [Digitaria exilis]|uniref:Uncharacterized protein n=1 Tax=Digitaria exilis TaxID=1010633 RepID=A0A835F748_9POAL|nr:hypothetical protein HU200_016988 [Digitaria exilis]
MGLEDRRLTLMAMSWGCRIAHPIHGLRLRTVDLLDVSFHELEVYDLLGHKARAITLPVGLFDASEMVVLEDDGDSSNEEEEEK